jgi:hypothetical protein
MSATKCEFKASPADEKCGDAAKWIADIGWSEETAQYEGTSWNVALCERHYEQLLAARRITGTAHKVST